MSLVKYAALVYPNILFFPEEGFTLESQDSVRISVQSANETFNDSHWGNWLGSVAWEDFSRSRIQLVTWMPSANPEVIDSENQALENRTYRFAKALMFQDLLVPPSNRPWILSGKADLVDG